MATGDCPAPSFMESDSRDDGGMTEAVIEEIASRVAERLAHYGDRAGTSSRLPQTQGEFCNAGWQGMEGAIR